MNKLLFTVALCAFLIPFDASNSDAAMKNLRECNKHLPENTLPKNSCKNSVLHNVAVKEYGLSAKGISGGDNPPDDGGPGTDPGDDNNGDPGTDPGDDNNNDGDSGHPNNGHGNDPDGNDNSNPGHSNDSGDNSDADSSPGHSGDSHGKGK